MGKVFNFFTGNGKNGKGVSKAQVEKDKKMGFLYFFKLTWSHLGGITATTLIFTLCNFPIFTFLLGLSGTFDSYVSTPSYPLYSTIYGLTMCGENGAVLADLNSLYGVQTSLQVVSTLSTVLMYSAILLAFTFGLSSVGLMYNIRNIVRGESIMAWSDFFTAIKKNFKQGIVMSLLEAVFIFFLYYDIVIYYANLSTGNFFNSMAFYLVVIVAILYFVMRHYIYTIIVTFDLKFRSVLKNSLFLLFLGFKRSLAAIAGIAVSVFVMFYIYLFLPSFGLLLPFVIGIGFIAMIGVYCSFPVIEKYMITPYYEDHPDERLDKDLDDVQSVFTDQG